jgi:tripartite-type tricarboxylate transporter receptor subunit TctC
MALPLILETEMKRTFAQVLVAALPALVGASYAQETFPVRPITIVVPYPAGGTSDGQVRKIQEPLSKLLGQPVVVDNKPGASGALAAMAVARAKPDGYTLLYPNNGVLIAALLNKKAGYEPIKDFKPVGLVTSVPMVLVAAKSVPARNLKEFLDFARKEPMGMRYASAGTASFGHLATARFGQVAGIKLEHIPYKGEAAATMAVRSGEVQVLMTTPSSAMLGQVEQGNLTLLGVATEKPSPVVPGAPTISQSVPGFVSEAWFGLLAPAGTPDPVIAKINAAVQKVMAEEAIRSWLQTSGALPKTSSPSDFSSVMNKEMTQWQDVITQYDIKAE